MTLKTLLLLFYKSCKSYLFRKTVPITTKEIPIMVLNEIFCSKIKTDKTASRFNYLSFKSHTFDLAPNNLPFKGNPSFVSQKYIQGL